MSAAKARRRGRRNSVSTVSTVVISLVVPISLVALLLRGHGTEEARGRDKIEYSTVATSKSKRLCVHVLVSLFVCV